MKKKSPKKEKSKMTVARSGKRAAVRLDVLGLRGRSVLEQHRVIGTGLRYSLVGKLQEALGLSLKALAEELQIPMRTLARRREEGAFAAAESERLLRLASLYEKTVDVFEGDEDAARRWLTTARSALGGHSPLELARTEVGAREVEDLIGRLEHGVFV
jgi:putative toxin-antitoxin system antitoxin component (TIGR02293 family)